MVSILVVMDVAFAVPSAMVGRTVSLTVSILVVMDVAFAENAAGELVQSAVGLNPCCNGCCFRS